MECSEQSEFQNADGHKIFCRYWSPQGNDGQKPRALVLIAHGAGEHSQWYNTIAEALTKHAIFVFANDHVGHGLSGGPRMHVENFQVYIRDVQQHIDLIKKRFPDSPLFIIGHSMGGAIAVLTALEKPEQFSGVVLEGAAIVPNPATATAVKVSAAKLVAWLFPQMPIAPIKSEWTSRNLDCVRRYTEDPLVYHGGLKARWCVCFLKALQEIQSRLSQVTWPVFVMHGECDLLCEISGSKLLHQHATSTDKTLKIYPGAYHQLHQEPDGQGEEAIQDMVDWITQRAPEHAI